MGRREFTVLLLLAVLLGAGLRTARLADQVLGDDEMHAVRAAIQKPIGAILVTYQTNDNCIPLTALLRFAIDRGIRLDELKMRALPVVSGVILLIVAPWLWRGLLPRSSLITWAWLLAVSPILISYSRLVRSYMPTVLLSLVAVQAFYRATLSDGAARRWGWLCGYGFAGALATWFHLAVAPFVAAPLLFHLGEALWRRTRRTRSLVEVVGTGLWLGLLVLLFLLPARESFLELWTSKGGRTAPSLGALGESLVLQSGVRVLPVALVFWVVAGEGLATLLRTSRRFAIYGITLLLVQLLGLLVVAPVGSSHPLILNRYLLVWCPVVLLWAAAGITQSSWILRRGRLTPWFAPAFLVLLFALGPYTDRAYLQSSFQHHNRYVRFSKPRSSVPSEDVPDFYRQLRDEEGEGAIYEYPWHYAWPICQTFPAYQEVHGRPVYVVYRDGQYIHNSIDWIKLGHFSSHTFMDRPVRYFVLHRDVGAEERAMREPDFVSPYLFEREWNRHQRHALTVASILKSDWGKPMYEGPKLIVWDLDRVREEDPDWQAVIGTEYSGERP